MLGVYKEYVTAFVNQSLSKWSPKRLHDLDPPKTASTDCWHTGQNKKSCNAIAQCCVKMRLLCKAIVYSAVLVVAQSNFSRRFSGQ